MSYKKIAAKGAQLQRLIYKGMTINVLCADAVPSMDCPGPFTLIRHKDVSKDYPLWTAMQEAWSWNEGEILRRRELGDTCYMVLDGETCVHYSWVTQRMRYISEVGYKVILHENDHWIYDCYTTPSHRGKSIYPWVLSTIVTETKFPQGGRVWIDVEDRNVSSMKGITKAGFIHAAQLQRKVILATLAFHRTRRILSGWGGDYFNRLPFQWLDKMTLTEPLQADYGYPTH